MRRRGLLVGAAGLLASGAAAQAPGVITSQLRFDSRGRSIRAVAFRPESLTTPAAGLVYLHGSGSIGRQQLRFARTFAEQQRMLVFVPVYTDAGPDDGVRRAPLMNAWRDCADDAADWLIAEGVDPRRVAVTGYSLGSYIAVDSVLGGGHATAAVGIAAGWDVYPPRPPRRRIPVLIVRAASDDHVSPSSTDRLIRFLRDADVPVRDSRIPDAEHLMSDPHWVEAQRLTADFVTDVFDLTDLPA